MAVHGRPDGDCAVTVGRRLYRGQIGATRGRPAAGPIRVPGRSATRLLIEPATSTAQMGRTPADQFLSGTRRLAAVVPL